MFTIREGQAKDYFALQLTLLKSIGVDIKGNTTNVAYRIYSAVMLSILYGYPLFQGCDVFRYFHETEIFVAILLYNTVYWITAAKITVLLSARRYVCETLTSIEKGVFEPVSDAETSIIKKYIRIANIMSIVYLVPTTASFITGVSGSITSRIRSHEPDHWKFPMGHFGAFNVTYSPNYELALILQATCSLVSTMGTMFSDIIIVTSLIHVMIQFKLLQYRIKTVLTRAEAMNEVNSQESVVSYFVDPSKIPWEYLKTALNRCIFHHTEILALSEKLENTFTYIYLLQFLLSSISICFTIYSCSLFPINDVRFLHYVQATLVLSFQVLYFCYWGNEVTLNSLAIASACHEVDYVGADVRFQKGLALMIQRSQRPVEFTAGKFAGLSLDTFVAIIRASYSYYTVMSSR